MTTSPRYPRSVSPAFTLVELLVVIAIIGIIAGIILGAMPAITGGRVRKTVKTEIESVGTAIDSYHARKGFYPPDNPLVKTDRSRGNTNTLFYELVGTRKDGTEFTAVSPEREVYISAARLNAIFGVAGFVNSSAGNSSKPENFYPAIQAHQVAPLPGQAGPLDQQAHGLVVPARGPTEGVNLLYYDASSPDRHNSESYDLWAIIKIGNTTNIIGNWKD